MQNIINSLSDSDIKIILCCLDVMPAYEDFDNIDYVESVFLFCDICSTKLLQHKPLNEKDINFITLSLGYAHKALRGEVLLEPDDLENLSSFSTAIDKLLSLFISIT